MTFRPAAVLIATLSALLLAACSSEEDAAPIVLAPSSMQEAIGEAADAFARGVHAHPVVSFAGTPALARQVLAGSPADLFISADEEWMDRIEAAGKIDTTSRVDLAGNRLVLVEPIVRAETLVLDRTSVARALGSGPFAMADPASVPAGRYGKAALEHLGLWPLSAPVSASENVRAALALIEREQAPLGLVYASDAHASAKVAVVASLPPESHAPIRYPMALIAGSTNPAAREFYAFLRSDEGQAILRAHGFTAP
ncbi:molybdate ABC transporter substrate-binding protein [Altererythrobacter salegens]|uniref:Molybdate ABC transporter substrate-binding protein n=1 Tax=Croceibacterium salegens TaxID=1737568 RepID=A0A6I4SYC7_9SPHN|nr:molybdate ABC transporter substrate-binding protein [Croceibacterium salegens]MXO60843.1 molybdate ABC transporter substrate-binding protein [Croceibacterium salegens]